MSGHSLRYDGGIVPKRKRRSEFWAMPFSSPGRWSLASAALFWMFLAVFYGLVAANVGVGVGGAWPEAWPLWTTMSAVAATGVLAAVLGFVALLGKAERSVMVFLSTLLGLLVTLFLSGEVLFPH